jgi:hypothetical protein
MSRPFPKENFVRHLSLRLLPVIFMLFVLFPHHAKADDQPQPTPLAIEVDIRGGIVGFDVAAFATARAIMASLVMDGTLENWIMTSRGMEGGGTYCMQFQPEFLSRKPRVLKQFQTLQVNLASTAYSVRELDHCEIPTR